MYNQRILGIKDHPTRAWMKYIWRDVNRDKFGFFGTITGLPSSGKTLTNMALMWLQDPSFTVDTVKDRITRNPRQFIKNLNELSMGEYMSMTDAGLSSSISSKNWMKLGNIIMEDVTQVQRIKRCGITLDVQIVKFIDNRVRVLLQWFTEVRRFGNNPPTWKIHRVKVNQIQDKITYPHPIIRMGKRLFKLRYITMDGMLTKGFIREWEDIEVEFKEKIMKDSYTRIDKIEQEENPMSLWDMIEKVKNDTKEYENVKGKIDADLIMLKMDIGRSKASQIVKYLRKELRK